MARRPGQARALMIQGTASHVGKSVIVAAFCRLFARAGYRVAPFKAQNMSNNSFVTRDGGEIGRAQAFQARAAGLEPHVDMNPVLLKPEADTRAQVVVLGKALRAMNVAEYHQFQSQAWQAVRGALARLRASHDLVIIEGAGSPAEINLRDRDIANMRLASWAHAAVLLVGDIERGGVFAALVGTMALLRRAERRLVRGLLINKFRGDPSLLISGLRDLEARLKVPVLGVLPYVHDLPVEEEDSVGLGRRGPRPQADLDVVVIRLPRISNATDFAPLEREADVGLRYVERAAQFGQPDLVLVPGTKSTVADYRWMIRQGLDRCLREHLRRGGWLMGICGGYQILGREVRDPLGVESKAGRVEGLGLLPVSTVFEPAKHLAQVEGFCQLAGLEGIAVRGYEIHHGRTEGQGARPAFRLRRRAGQAVDQPDGAAIGLHCFGTYIHGLFDQSTFRRAFLNRLRERKGLAPLAQSRTRAGQEDFDLLADWLAANVDLGRLAQVTGLPRLAHGP